jgi:cation transport ATPase
MVLGHRVEMRSISQAQGALKELAKLLPDTSARIVGDRIETVAVPALGLAIRLWWRSPRRSARAADC